MAGLNMIDYSVWACPDGHRHQTGPLKDNAAVACPDCGQRCGRVLNVEFRT